MGYIQGDDRRQQFLLPPSIDEYVDESSPVRVLDAFVDGLDLEALSFTRSTPASTGRPGYDPRDLLKLYVYGYANQIRSSPSPDARVSTQSGSDLSITRFSP